ncbi:MAG: tRNA (adenosine(37)-N6)-threonylcarbamoyltransferase complex dimerization subunit type 1 TsaB [PS1 clade bacterium]|uniref:tRNA (Adenosine(37)-N6)-threonylcarbamoyltransferase complex dimerization subunit type 1 TsaB n=1 Tax=PS1 clade bacterium TaxID=2175152 RepID=A0A368E3G8_9PROT|nr:MAG: tRNA (adenosine(37)-N6)-threonylcarbamoyltransferase complex dimerization subunit type 1 TsaB [PS1 clade bacterium]HAK98621.1 tRNA (adenosine(37)-N6)-threonylcarbamoyltransferase complex dimerization subunit type 1 TsaB [Rhodobiaceae bacterium]HCV49286.1 tRNA (adenosine(37)-N6)-threonylcarbamoyltransferase complex dimerization subunit type 1 TsaB [Rhodobiaceae bacterium]|tara:strand:+ start:281 stop:1021 length:741 start_codon:yes stop_codon:yes gene_type:complete
MLALLPNPQHRPLVLVCDTSQQACSVALALPDGSIIERLEETGRGHTEKLPLMIADILTSSSVGLKDVERLGVTIGPGTFAGVRVGLAAMRAIRISHQLPIYAITTTHAIVLPVQQIAGGNEERQSIVVIDARRGELYCQIFDAQGVPISDAMAHTAKGLVEIIEKQGITRPNIIGSGAEILAAQMQTDDLTCLEMPFWPQAGLIAEWVARQEAIMENTPPPEPLYLRPPDAALPSASSYLTRLER